MPACPIAKPGGFGSHPPAPFPLGFRRRDKASDDSDDGRVDDFISNLDLTLIGGMSDIGPLLLDTASDRSEDILTSLGIPEKSDFSAQANDRAAAYAKSRSAEMVKQIDESTRKRLRDIISDELEDGSMREDIIGDILELGLFGEECAELIADTEIAMATGQGALVGYKEARAAGVKMEKIWVTDADPCDICQENADAGAIDIDDESPSGDQCETAHPKCECHTEFVVEDNSVEDDDV